MPTCWPSAGRQQVRLRAENTPLPPSIFLAVVLLPAQHTPAYWCLFLRSLARSLALHSAAHTDMLVPVSPLARSLSDCHTPTHWCHCASRSVCCVPLARSLASYPLDRSLSTRSLARSLLARSLSGCRTDSHTPIHWCHPPSARYSGDIPQQQTAPAMSMLLSRPPWWVCGGDTDARHLPISASSINRKNSRNSCCVDPAGRWCLCQGETESYLALTG